jgi:hypothetical protein
MPIEPGRGGACQTGTHLWSSCAAPGRGGPLGHSWQPRSIADRWQPIDGSRWIIEQHQGERVAGLRRLLRHRNPPGGQAKGNGRTLQSRDVASPFHPTIEHHLRPSYLAIHVASSPYSAELKIAAGNSSVPYLIFYLIIKIISHPCDLNHIYFISFSLLPSSSTPTRLGFCVGGGGARPRGKGWRMGLETSMATMIEKTTILLI